MNSSDHLPLHGHCTCGAVRYRMNTPPVFVHCCHCRWCQRESGSAFALNAMIESDRLEVLAGAEALERVQIPTQSGKGQTVVRCRHCLIALWSHYAYARDALSFVRVGTLDEPERLPPDIHIYTASRQPWVVLPPHTPAVPAYYDSAQYWPAQSQERAAALLAKLAAAEARS